ncbi:hypothetical protein SSP24_70540 [Streptomyces spinoverrucosus]|uniref:Uncharacterized protein n=1 Tax=Streptomyces spinoverrucosus TaxID=284043 RepID=A0A4Y3VUR4_9ACTN|nr:hypothetical protein SSP24_70540 [Streptomyces spinoverrucosus]GHB61418.1 hypothetical protein GCM10010397_34680 [Streptomyces spinoverrucosus]
MIWSAALSGAAARVLRAAAGRRALHLGLLVGGLFVLGVLCGERADAAEAAPGPEALARVAAPVVVVPGEGAGGEGRVGGSRGGALGSRGVAEPAVEQPLVEGVGRSVGERVVRPVGDVVETVTGRLAGTEGRGSASAGLPSRPESPSSAGGSGLSGSPDLSGTSERPGGLPEAPGLPGVSGVPALPGLPAFPGFPGLPQAPVFPGGPVVPGVPQLPGVCELPVRTLPLPDTVVSLPGGVGGSASYDGGSEERGRAVGAVGVHGPGLGVAFGGVGAAVDRDGVRQRGGAGGEYVPGHRAPAGGGDGVLGSRSAADSGSSRHGDAHAVTVGQRAPQWLMPGAAVRVEADGTRDRHRDIPVFPG